MDEQDATGPALESAVALLREGTASSTALHGALLALGRANAVGARLVIEPYLTHPESHVRQVAVRVLVGHLRLADHGATALQMLAHDPDEGVRMTAATALGTLQRDTHDRYTLGALAPVVVAEDEDPLVRQAAYLAMRAIVQYDPREQLALAARDMDVAAEVDWPFVYGCLPTKPMGT